MNQNGIVDTYVHSKGPFVPVTQPEPESARAARDEIRQLGLEILGICNQLGEREHYAPDGRPLTFAEVQEWRRRAKSAHRFKQERKVFLEGWLRAHAEDTRREPRPQHGLSATALAHDLTRSVGLLESVFVAAQEFCEDPTTERHAELSQRVAQALTSKRGPVVIDDTER